MSPDFFRNNRSQLIDALDGGLIILTAYTAQQQRGDTAFRFSQEANFWYLTGIDYADWQLVVDGGAHKSWLIAPVVDEMHALFNSRLTFNEAKQASDVDEVLERGAGEELLQELAKKHSTVYTLEKPPRAERFDFALNPASVQLEKQLKRLFGSVQNCSSELAKLRAIKQSVEVEAIEKAAQISVAAFQVVTSRIPHLSYEYEAEAILTHEFRRNNARHAFEPIVALGKNACTLHYESNSSQLQTNELLLIDAGARVGEYPADITRTFGLGVPSKRQVAVHAAVQAAEEQIIQCIKPGGTLKEYAASTDVIMKEALLSLGLMKHKDDLPAYRRYFPHAISHGLGIDVHENLGGYKNFEPGMVLTVEPGIYIPEENIGVRIEDDILVTPEGGRNLTAGLSTDL